MPDAGDFEVARFAEPALERDRDLLGKTDADETAGRDRIAVADELHRVGGGHDLALLVTLEIGQRGMFHGCPCATDGAQVAALLRVSTAK